MQQYYQDDLAIVNKTWKPDLFLTMTCNTKWRGIEENSLPDQQACGRPDIVTFFFILRKKTWLIWWKKKFFLEK